MKRTSVFLFVLWCLVSCAKKKDQNPSPLAPNPYYQAAIGNYWVYKNYQLDSSGEEALPGIDTVTVSGDSIINGKRYAVFSGINSVFYPGKRVLDILRDSSGCLVDQFGVVRLSSTNFTDTLSTSYVIGGTPENPDTFYVYKWFMQGPPQSLRVPAGTFNVLNGIQKLTVIPSGNTVTMNYSHCYAPGVGLVMSQDNWEYQIRQGIYYERRLVSYHVNAP